MNKTLKFLIFVMVFCCLFYISNYEFAYQHEAFHYQNCVLHGGRAEIEINKFDLSGATHCTITADKEVIERTKEIDMQNELVGYNVRSVLFAFWAISFFWFVVLMFRRS